MLEAAFLVAMFVVPVAAFVGLRLLIARERRIYRRARGEHREL